MVYIAQAWDCYVGARSVGPSSEANTVIIFARISNIITAQSNFDACICSYTILVRRSVAIVMWSDDWQPDSYVDRIDHNLLHGNHTLCLLGMV